MSDGHVVLLFLYKLYSSSTGNAMKAKNLCLKVIMDGWGENLRDTCTKYFFVSVYVANGLKLWYRLQHPRDLT